MDRVHVLRRLLRVGGQGGGEVEPHVPAPLMMNELPGSEVVSRVASHGKTLRLEVEELLDLLWVSEGKSNLLHVHHHGDPGLLLHHLVLPRQILAPPDPLLTYAASSAVQKVSFILSSRSIQRVSFQRGRV